MIKVTPLSTATLNDAIVLVKKIFVSKIDQNISPKSLKESLSEISSVKTYWVAVERDGETVGITGLYKDSHNKDTIWLGWFGVHPGYRRRGIGSTLLEFTIKEAKRRGFSILKLYTSSGENEKAAHGLYKKFGFILSDTNKKSDKVYLIKNLTNNKAQIRRRSHV
jgi:GNAT superfamily N-acetyltransferase